MDGVRYSITDSVLGIWVMNWVTGRRHLWGLVRKRLVCRCGCKGWCTYWPILNFIKWSLEQLKLGLFPSQRHDGGAWLPSDELRKGLAGMAMKFRCLLMHLKGDWAEVCHFGAFPTQASSIRPCYCCNCFSENMHDPECPWRINTDEDYDTACSRCEIWVDLTQAMHSTVQGLLFFDKRPQGYQGRALRNGIPALGLEAGDRLEPNESLWDIGDQFDNLDIPAGQSVRILFWRKEKQTLCTHRSPL